MPVRLYFIFCQTIVVELNHILRVALNVPLTPTTPTSPTSFSALPSPSADGKSKKSNPLIDLVETERLYVDQLTGIIRVRARVFHKFYAVDPM